MSALRILLVEDNELNLVLARDLLEARGHEVVSASSPAEAMRMAIQSVPDLVLMDIMLPEMDGVALMRELRKLPAWPKVPFIAFTAHAMSGDRERLILNGFAGYISKPIETRHFAAAVEHWAQVKQEGHPG
jgi:CheY-like chemotaxis protein